MRTWRTPVLTHRSDDRRPPQPRQPPHRPPAHGAPLPGRLPQALASTAPVTVLTSDPEDLHLLCGPGVRIAEV